MSKARSDFGISTEVKFIQRTFDMRDQGLFPEWLYFFCAALESEDREGVDAWAYTDVGKIALQIKSGKKGRREHLSRENRRHIPCVVVPPHTAFEKIFEDVLAVLTIERTKLKSGPK